MTKRLLVVFLISQLVVGCGSFVTARYYELGSDAGQTLDYRPSHCGEPESTVLIKMPNGAYAIISGWGGGVNLEIPLNQTDTFQFVSGTLDPVQGWPAEMSLPTLRMIDVAHQPTDRVTRASIYGGTIRAEVKVERPSTNNLLTAVPALKSFELRLPDAYLNGVRFSFPSVSFTYKEERYYQDLCLR